jgi:NAD+ diphosphatase
MPAEYQPLTTPPDACSEPALWFAFHRSELLVRAGADQLLPPSCRDLSELGLASARQLYLGTYGGQHCYASELKPPQQLPAGHELQGLRTVYGHIDEPLAMLAGRAFQYVDWDRNHQYCSRCGTPTAARRDERARLCPNCKYKVYPPVSPAIMILIMHGRKLLLARKAQSPPNRYSALAGFVEPGETLEATVRRETREEVGVEIDKLSYFGSQPWPFPHSLMIAFTAHYAGGDIRPDGTEIVDARWFDIDELPVLPPSISISRRMINAVAARLARGELV